VTPIIFLLLITLLLVLLGGNNLKQALLGVGVVAAGLPVYYIVLRPGNTKVKKSEAEESHS
jgi:hypothetical protein